VAQLHLALPSPVATIEREDKGKFANQPGKFDELAFMIRQFDIGKLLADFQVHDPTCEFNQGVNSRRRHGQSFATSAQGPSFSHCGNSGKSVKRSRLAFLAAWKRSVKGTEKKLS
jgi:hypothetical protein